MRRYSGIARFLAVFVLVYGGMVVPGPSWNARYGNYFRTFCSCLLAHETTTSIVRFRAAPAGAALDTQIVLVDPHQASAHGMAKARILGLDSRGVGWVPTAFLCALILASWIPWKRRLGALALGLLALHLYLLLAVRVYIWNQSIPDLGAGTPTSILKWVATGLEETMIDQLGPSFVVPAVIWIVVTFRKEDLDAARGRLGLGGQPSAPNPRG